MASSSNWTAKQNTLFENALALFDDDAPDRWETIAKAVGDKTAEEVKCHYEMLVHDIDLIEAGRVPLPKYKNKTTRVTATANNITTGNTTTGNTTTSNKRG